MGSGSGGDCSLPLLPDGARIFETLPFAAIVLDALAAAVGDGVITVRGPDAEGVLVIREGGVSDSVWVVGGIRTTGDAALTLIRAGAVSVSASRLSGDALALVGPLIRAVPCYADLRLDWVVWPELLKDLRERNKRFVVELATPVGRGIAVIDEGRQMATYAESHPAFGDPSLLDDLAAGRVGTIRVLIDPGGISAVPAAPAPFAVAVQEPRPDVVVVRGTDPTADHPDDPNAMLSALFGPRPDATDHVRMGSNPSSPSRAATPVQSVLPQLKSLIQSRLQRSSGSVEEIVDIAASDHQSLEWLADRVRVMTVRGFLPSTFDQLATDMLALASHQAD